MFNMSKTLTVSVADWVYDEIVETRPEGKSRSEWVEELIIKAKKEDKNEKRTDEANIGHS